MIAPPTVSKPRLRGWFHQVAFFLSIPAGVVLIVVARGALARAAAAIYAAGLTALFGVSAAYHRVNWSPRARTRMKRLDHSMIFVLIASSYTPVAVLALDGPWSVVILATAWAGAATGIALKMSRIDGLHVVTGALYLSLGWLAVVAFPQLLRGLSEAAIGLMLAGGILYTAGAAVLGLHRPDPSPTHFGYHEIWHGMMTAAAGCHYAMVLLVLRAAG